MTIKELKGLLDSAIKKLEADPKNAELKSAFETAKANYEAALADLDDQDDEEDGTRKKAKSGSGSDDEDEEEDDSLDEGGLDPKTKAYVEKLRRQNAKYRTSAKDARNKNSELVKQFKAAMGVTEDEDHEAVAKRLREENDGLVVGRIILEQAVEHGVGKADREMFEFFVNKKLQSLEEGEELSEDDFAEAAKKAKRASRGLGSGDGQDDFRTSVDSNVRGNPDKKKTGQITLEKFKEMTVTEKSDLYVKDRVLYNELFAQAYPKRKAS